MEQKKSRILCVDDEINILRCLQRSFRTEPYEVLVANSGPEALEILKQEEVDLVISDQRMPEMTGSQLLKEIKKQYPHVIRIMLSGYSDFDSLVQAINEGEIYRFISKPWNNEELINMIRGIFEQRRIIQIAQKELESLSQLTDLCEKIEIVSNEAEGSVLLKFVNTEDKIPDGLVSRAINAVLNVLGIDGEKNPELLSGSIYKKDNGVQVIINLEGGIQLKLEMQPNE